jgi:hypothetical protein
MEYYGILCWCTLVQKWEILQCGAGVPHFLRMKSSGNLVEPFKRRGFVVLRMSQDFLCDIVGSYIIWWYMVGDLHCFEGEVLGLVGLSSVLVDLRCFMGVYHLPPQGSRSLRTMSDTGYRWKRLNKLNRWTHVFPLVTIFGVVQLRVKCSECWESWTLLLSRRK